nr:uncharacterized protein Rv2082-like [Aegilops tauschii subsp. strangulata]
MRPGLHLPSLSRVTSSVTASARSSRPASSPRSPCLPYCRLACVPPRRSASRSPRPQHACLTALTPSAPHGHLVLLLPNGHRTRRRQRPHTPSSPFCCFRQPPRPHGPASRAGAHRGAMYALALPAAAVRRGLGAPRCPLRLSPSPALPRAPPLPHAVATPRVCPRATTSSLAAPPCSGPSPMLGPPARAVRAPSPRRSSALLLAWAGTHSGWRPSPARPIH